MFFDVFSDLCKKKGVSPSRAALEMGINKGTVSVWKKGTYMPRQDTLQKIAEYFSVSVDYLLENKETPPAPARDVSDDDIKFALFKGKDGVTDAMYDEVKAFAEFIKQKYEKG